MLTIFFFCLMLTEFLTLKLHTNEKIVFYFYSQLFYDKDLPHIFHFDIKMKDTSGS